MNPDELIERFFQLAQSNLKSAKTPADHARVMARVYAAHGELQDEIKSTHDLITACKSGCFYCCYLKVDAKAHEVFYLVEHIHRTLNTKQIADLITRCKAHTDRVVPQTLEEQLGSNNECPLLVENKCSVYDGRPFSCRIHHSQSVDPCIAGYEDPSDITAPGAEFYLLRAAGSAAWLSCSAAYAKEGYDDRTYDLGLALYEALTNPKCVKRWRDKKTAFSTQCIVKDQRQG